MKSRNLVLSIVFSFALAPCGFTQSATTGQLIGTITDSTGALVPNASVTLTVEGQQRTVSTDRQGFYRFTQLPPGSYTLTFAA